MLLVVDVRRVTAVGAEQEATVRHSIRHPPHVLGVHAIDGTPVYERGCRDPQGDPAGQRKLLTYLRGGIRAEAEIETDTLIP